MKTNEQTNISRHGLLWLGVFAVLMFMGLLLCTARANAASVVASGDCGAQGDNVKWSLDSGGTLTISGKGEMDFFDITEYYGIYVTTAYWGGKNHSRIKKVVIKNGVTSIGNSAFGGCSSLTSVTIPDSVTSIGSYAFYNCSSLKSVTIPSSVTSIGISVFEKCSDLTSVTIPDSVTSIGSYAFWYCDSLTSVTIPDSVTSIGNSAFYGCSSLKSVTIGDSVTNIGSDAFYETLLYNNEYNWINDVLYIGKYLIQAETYLSGAYTIKAGTKCIADYAFAMCTKLTSVTIPNSVSSIGEKAFWNCSNLTSVTIPNSVTSIGDNAFGYCSGLKSVTIPDGVTSIGEGAFYKTALYKKSANWENDVLYIGKYLIRAKESLSGAYTIKTGTKCIADYAFFKCTKLTSLTIPDSVTNIGEFTFQYCRSLTSVTIPNSATSIGRWAFDRCTSLKSVTVPSSVTTIGVESFLDCKSLKKVIVMNPKCKIGDGAFHNTPATIYGYKNSTAQAYAEHNNMMFVTIECNHTYGSTVYTKQATTAANGMTYKVRRGKDRDRHSDGLHPETFQNILRLHRKGAHANADHSGRQR